MILAPLMFFSFYEVALNRLSTGQMLIVVIWGGVGIIGSVWGISYITKTRLNLLERIKSLFSRRRN